MGHEHIIDEEWGQLYQGDSREVLRILPAGSVDSVVTDPP
jgi:DNA modification methylase